MIAALMTLFPLSWPESLRKAAAWASVAVVAIALLIAAKAIYDGTVVEGYETTRTVERLEAPEISVEQRAMDAVIEVMAKERRVEAIETAAASEAAKPVVERAKLPPTTLTLNCTRFREAYSEAELATMPAYRENC